MRIPEAQAQFEQLRADTEAALADDGLREFVASMEGAYPDGPAVLVYLLRPQNSEVANTVVRNLGARGLQLAQYVDEPDEAPTEQLARGVIVRVVPIS